MSHRSRSLKEKPRTNIPLAQDSLNTARSDLKSAKALYNNECYPNAVYHLQQSLEKAWKSFGFFYGIITEGQARSKDIIGHKGSKVCTRTILTFKKVVRHMRMQVKALKNVQTSYSAEQSALIMDEDHLETLDDCADDLLREINNFASNEDNLRNMPYNEMKQLVDSLTDLQRMLDDFELKLDTQINEEFYEKVRERAYRIWRPLVVGNPYAELILKKTVWEDLKDDMIRDMIKCTIHGIAVTAPLFRLAVITQVHEQTTRYRMDGLSPESIYTPAHPMIQLFPQILALSETALFNLKSLYVELPPYKDNDIEEGSPP